MPYEALETWHDFFGLVGASAATLVGLTFVAASVGSSVFTEERQVGLRTLLSPTVVAFAGVLAACIVGVLPALGRGVSSALFSIVGSLGALYSMFIWRSMVREGIAGKLDIEDRLWYAFAGPRICNDHLGRSRICSRLQGGYAVARGRDLLASLFPRYKEWPGI